MTWFRLMFILLLGMPLAHAEMRTDTDNKPLVVEDAWALETPLAGTMTIGMVLVNRHSQPVRVVGLDSDVGAPPLMRLHTTRDGVKVVEFGEFIEIPARSRVRLVPGATEILIENVKRAYTKDEEITLSFTFADKRTQRVRVRIRP
jgi:copper(I)-binding protein